jgi:ABC-type phosphate/phosphonate transport system permease subunit
MNRIKTLHKWVLDFALKRNKQRQFLWLAGLILLLFFGYSWYAGNMNVAFLIATGALVLLSFTIPAIAMPFLYIWMFLGRILSEILSTVLLGVIFLIGIIPVALVRKRKSVTTGWQDPRGTSDFNNQF